MTYRSNQLALSLPLEDKLILAKSMKKAMLEAPVEEQPKIKQKIRALFTEIEWKQLKNQQKGATTVPK